MARTKKPSTIKEEPAAAAPPAHFIQAWRIIRKFKTQTALAEATKAHDPKGVGLHRVTIVRLESGLVQPKQWHLKLLSNTLRVSCGDLLSTDPNSSGDILSIYALASASQKKAILGFAQTVRAPRKRR